MPTASKKACSRPGCPNLVEKGKRFCSEHESRDRKSCDERRGTAAQRGYGGRWQRYRERYLKAHPLCAGCERQGRLTQAAEVDHIIPVSGPNDPLFWDAKNHQSLCRACHAKKTALENRGPKASAGERAKVTVVCGPPGAGKTEWVARQARWGDLIVNLDALFTAISGLPEYEKPDCLVPFALAARDAVIRRLKLAHSINRAWIITTGAKAGERASLQKSLKAEIVVFEVSENECLRRIQADERRKNSWQSWQPVIERWWREYQRRPGETVLRK